jgi:hypothetical protein
VLTKIVLRKLYNERIWSISLVGLLTIGLVIWIVVPSLSASLEEGLRSYNNSVGTYLFVYNTGEDSYQSRLPSEVTTKIHALLGVQEAYPIVNNFTYFIDAFTMHLEDRNITINRMQVQSAGIGGQNGFPEALISLSAGRVPGNEAAFLLNGLATESFKINQSYAVDFSESSQKFNATAVGQMPYNPMLQQAAILWNSTFLQQQLGSQLYEQTFGGEGANLFIVKAQDIGQVEKIADSLKSIFEDYPGYSIIYDQTSVKAQLSFQSGTGVLYDLIGVASFFSVSSIIFLITQGWKWRMVLKVYVYYYTVLGILATALSTFLSILIAGQIGYSFQVYATTLTIPTVISPYLLISGFIISILVSIVAAYFGVWRMKQMGLDNLLREY